MAGCGLDPALREQIAREAGPLRPSVTDDDAVKALASSVATDGVPPPTDWPLASDAGLDDYIEEALSRNPAIRRAIRDLEALGERVPQVTSLDDPMVTFIPPTGDMIQTAAGMMDGSVGATQRIPYPAKLRTKGRIAEQDVRIAFDNLADVRIRTVAEVRRAYYGYYLADVSIDLTQQSADLLRQIRDVAAARYRAGAATQQDVLRAEVELYSLTNRLITLGQQRATAMARLNTAMNRQVDAPLPAPRPVDLTGVDWQLGSATEYASTVNPRLAALRQRVQRDLEQIKLAGLDYIPDLNVGYGYTFIAAPALSPVATGDDAWNLSFGLNLPIWWQRLRARVVQGNAQALSTVAEYEETRNLLFFSLQDTLARIDSQYRQALLDRDLIIPRAWQAVEVSVPGYQAGELEFEALIQNWRKWLDLSLAYEEQLAGLEQDFADLEQLVGVRLARAPGDAAVPALGDDVEGAER